MLCSRVLNLLNAYVDYELTGAEMLEIREHLAGCASCAREYASARQIKQLLRGLPTVEADRPFTPAVLEARPRLRFDLPEWYYRVLEHLRAGAAGLQRSACYMATGAALAFSVMAITELRASKRPDAARAHVPESLAAETPVPRDTTVLFEPQAVVPVILPDGSHGFYLRHPGFEPDMPRVRPVGYSRAHRPASYQPVFLQGADRWQGPSPGLYLELNDR